MPHETSKEAVGKDDVPGRKELMNPLIDALHELGGSGSIQEIYDEVGNALDLPDEVLDVPHTENGSRSELGYQLAWTRTYLKKYGVLENSRRGVWAIAADARDVGEVDPEDVVRTVHEIDRRNRASRESGATVDEDESEEAPDEVRSWRKQLHLIMTEQMTPGAFERLAKRLLRESGFVQVEVTGRSRDRGIDGRGIMEVGGFLKFHVVFQCKRYRETVSAHHVRDFRGATAGRADKGLLITTGTFTRDARREATRDGAQPIDLVDGEELADKLKELELGVNTEKEVVENVEVKEDWFRNI